MIPASQLKSASEYIAVVRPLLPREAFEPEPRHVVRIAAHLVIIAASYVVLRETGHWWVAVLASLVIGHSQACLVFLAHDLSHNAILKDALPKRVVELVVWGLNLIPPTLWQRVHNQTHHPETNTLRDTDRTFRPQEATTASWIYTRLFYPNRQTPLHHPFVLFHFVTYPLRHLAAALLPGDAKPSIVTFKPRYTAAIKRKIVLELTGAIAFQIALWFFLGGSGWRYVLAVPVPLLVASSVAMIYIFTNHFLNPLCEKADPLIGATSVAVPLLFDWLHDNNSYHTEHHLFPSMNPRFYPAVSALLAKHFPDRYNRLPIAEAWRRIWQHDEFIGEPDSLTPAEPAVPLAAE
jgi:fatty acid desaturase